MHVLKWLVILIAVGAVAAWATRPGIDDFDALLKAELERRIATSDIGTEGDAVATIALIGCKLRPSDCFELVRETLDVKVEDKTFFTRFVVKGLGHEANCTGAFTRIWCSESVLGD